jgi:hypothetical protein
MKNRTWLFPLHIVILLAVGISACNPIDINNGPTLTESPPTEVIPPTVDPVAADCARLQLTPEECANLGTHVYQVSIQAINAVPSSYLPCTVEDIETSSSQTRTITIAFGPDGSLEVKGTNKWWLHADGHFPQVSINTFERHSTDPSHPASTAVHSDTFVLNTQGFIHDNVLRQTGALPLDCTLHYVYALGKSLPLATQTVSEQMEATESAKSKPQVTGQDFGFRVESGACYTDVLDTFEGTFTKDLIADPPISIPLRLSSNQMQDVYAKMLAIDFFGYPKIFAIPTPTFGLMTLQMPAEKYHILVRSDGITKTLDWKDEIVEPSSPEADNLRDLFKMIEAMIWASPEYQQLPERNGGCA